MRNLGKKRREAFARVDRTVRYKVSEAIKLVKGCKTSKFDESIDAAINLGVDPSHADQVVRGAVVLPHGTGKTVRVAVFAKGAKAAEAEAAGADIIGADHLHEKIAGGFLDFDKVVATPDMMGIVGKLGRVLGPRGLMPNPKTGTVTMDVTKAIKEAKAGKVDFRAEKKGGIVHAPLGRISFESQKLEENFRALVDAIVKAKPTGAKGQYVQAITIASTMGPGVKVDLLDATSGASKAG